MRLPWYAVQWLFKPAVRTLGSNSLALWLPITNHRLDKGLWTVIRQLEREIDAKLAEKVQSSGPWFLCSDGATSKGQTLVTFDIANHQEERFHYRLVDCGHNRVDASFLKQELQKVVQEIPALAGISQDTARTCTRAFKDLHRDLSRGGETKYRRLTYVPCNEHVAQLLMADMSKRTPWMQDRFGVRHINKCLFPSL